MADAFDPKQFTGNATDAERTELVPCPYCDTSWNSQQSLNRHMSRKHRVEWARIAGKSHHAKADGSRPTRKTARRVRGDDAPCSESPPALKELADRSIATMLDAGASQVELVEAFTAIVNAVLDLRKLTLKTRAELLRLRQELTALETDDQI